MQKRNFILLVAGIMILSSFAILANNLPASTFPQNVSPAVSPASYYNGNVTIHPDGSVTGTSGTGAPPLRAISGAPSTGEVFSLSENVNGTITDQMNKSTVQGNGLTVNGKDKAAFIAFNVSGLVLENAVVVNTTSGIQLGQVSNAVVDNVMVNNTRAAQMVMMSVYYSSNVTIENSNFTTGPSSTNTYAIDAEYDTSVNISYNKFSGATTGYYVYSYFVGTLEAWGNSVKSSSYHSSYGFYFEGGNATFADNYVNATNEAIYVDGATSVITMNNFVNNTGTGFDIEYVSTYISTNDSAVYGSTPMYVYYDGTTSVQGANFRNSSSYVYVSYSSVTTFTDTSYTTISSSEAYYLEYGGNFNLVNSSIVIGKGASSSDYGIYAYYVSGWVNIAGDSINAHSNYGLYLDVAPQFNVTGSYINATDGIYVDNYAITGATVSGNTFTLPGGGEAMYFYAYDIYNINVLNNSIQSSNSSWGEYGVYVYAFYASSNVTVSNNYAINNYYPIYVYMEYYGTNLKIQNNTLVNSTDAIYTEDYFDTVITGNTVINVTGEGIYAYGGGTGLILSYNLVENLPGFGPMSYGIDAESYYSGNNIIAHNTVLNSGSSTYDIYTSEVYAALIYSNTVSGGEYGFYIYESGPVSLFGNTVNGNADYGIYSYYNSNINYYGNTVTNANTSFYSYDDYNGFVYANTFSETQANNSQIYFLSVYDNYGPIVFYHNNFINDTTNSTTYNYVVPYEGPVNMNAPLPVGGNYWSNYTGSGTNGIGSTPFNVTGSLKDMYPLTSMWTSPTVTFVETGLPSGTSWSVEMGGSLKAGKSASLVYSQVNGQYTAEQYTVSNVSGYTASTTSGTVSLDGSSSVVTVTFTPITYDVVFSSAGLPSGTSWSVTLNGKTVSSASGDITFNIANGSYSYSIAPVTGYTASPGSGTLSVSGSTGKVNVQFSPVTYTLTVDQTGLPSGDAWTVTVAGKAYNSTGDSISVQVVSGTYIIGVSGPSGYKASLQSSNVSVSNGNDTVNVTFTASKATGSSGSLYAGIGVGVVVGGAASLVGTMFYTGTGFFRRPGK